MTAAVTAAVTVIVIVTAIVTVCRFAEAEARANATQSAVALLERACVENGCRVQLKHVRSGRWLACGADALRRSLSTPPSSSGSRGSSSGSQRFVPAKAALQLRGEGDEACWWVFSNSTGVGEGGMLSYDGRRGVYLSPAAVSMQQQQQQQQQQQTIILGPPLPLPLGAAGSDKGGRPTIPATGHAGAVASHDSGGGGDSGGGLLLVATALPSEAATVAEAAVASGASGWELRPAPSSPHSASGTVLGGGGVPSSTGGSMTSMDTPVPPFPPALRRERVLEYDAIRYPFRQILARILISETDSDGGHVADDLGVLHESEEGRQFIRRSPKASSRNPYDRRYKAMAPSLRAEYRAIYLSFLRVSRPYIYIYIYIVTNITHP